MGRRLAMLLFVAAGLTLPGRASADNARGVGYVLNFRLGVETEQATSLIAELTKATTDWLGQEAKQGRPVAKSCASSRDCVREAASTLGVSRLGMVAIVAAGGVVRLEVRLLDANTAGEIRRTHTEYESAPGSTNAERAIFDLLPRLLPGEKAATLGRPPTPIIEPKPVLPPVSQIVIEPPNNGLVLETKTPPPAPTRWWLWGGLGAAATVAIVAGAFLMTRDDGGPSGPVLELPPPQ